MGRKLKIALVGFAVLVVGFTVAGMIITSSPDSRRHSTSASGKKPFSPLSVLFIEATPERTEDGRVVISGSTNLPDGLKLWVHVEEGRLPQGAPKEVAGDDDVFVENGKFATKPLWFAVPNTRFTKKGWPSSVQVDVREEPFPARPFTVHFESYFNGAWQTPEVLRVVGGEGGKTLKGKILKLTDPDVTDSDKIVDYDQTLSFPALSPEAKAISMVREAILTLPDEGRSTGDVQAVVDMYLASPGVKAGSGWGASRKSPSDFDVSFDFIDGQQGEQQAIWTANIATGKVKYVNENAKRFSWAPSY